MKTAIRFFRLLAAQFLWLRSRMPLVMVLLLALLPPAMVRLAHAGIISYGQLLSGLLQFDERFLPLWALVAGSIVWGDAEPGHRPLLFPWPVRSWELLLTKTLAAGLCYALLAGIAASALPALFTQATGQAGLPLPPGHDWFVRALLPGLVLMALAAAGSALGSPWLGLALGGSLWLCNLHDGGGFWLDRHTAGALNLFAWTRGSHNALAQVNVHTALVILALHAVALLSLVLIVRDGWGAWFARRYDK